MGLGRTSRSRKRKFHGNDKSSVLLQNTSMVAKNADVSTVSASKLGTFSDSYQKDELINNEDQLCGNRIIDMKILISIFSILLCPLCSASHLFLEENSRLGLASNLSLRCKNCEFVKGFSTSNKINKLNEVNTRFVFGLRLIGRGLSAGKKLCSILNLPPFLSKLAFRKQEKKILSGAMEVGENSMCEAAAEIKVIKNSKAKITSCGVSVDGTWQRRGYSSLNGCVSAISIDTGKVVDFEVMSQYCRQCNISKKCSTSSSHTCSKHCGSASSMEPAGVYRLFERSEGNRKLQYNEYYGDGDSKAYEGVKNIYKLKPKDLLKEVKKLECIGHIQKRVGTRLRKLKTTKKGLGGRGKLTDNFIDKLQNYYGIAIRSNVGDLEGMQSAVMAAFYHCISSKTEPKHGQCPIGADSWCKYQRAKFLKKTYQDKSSGLPLNVSSIVRPIYMELCDQKLLKKCLHGKTQNANESFNGVLWQIIPKEIFVELHTLRLGALLAVIQFNNGFKGVITILHQLGISTGYYTQIGYMALDSTRIADSKRHSLPLAKENRRKLRAIRKNKRTKNEEKEGPTYKSGQF